MRLERKFSVLKDYTCLVVLVVDDDGFEISSYINGEHYKAIDCEGFDGVEINKIEAELVEYCNKKEQLKKDKKRFLDKLTGYNEQ